MTQHCHISSIIYIKKQDIIFLCIVLLNKTTCGGHIETAANHRCNVSVHRFLDCHLCLTIHFFIFSVSECFCTHDKSAVLVK